MVNERYEYLLENFTKQELIERVMELEDKPDLQELLNKLYKEMKSVGYVVKDGTIYWTLAHDLMKDDHRALYDDIKDLVSSSQFMFAGSLEGLSLNSLVNQIGELLTKIKHCKENTNE